eukprot:31007-Pelagococcus_subviridis.AAC.9
MTDRVLIIEFRVRYSDRHRAIPAIPDEMEKYLRSHPKTNDRRHPVRVNLTGFADDCLKIGVEVHVHKMPLNAHLKVKSELLMGMMDIVEKHTSGVAFPVEVEDPYAFETKKRFGGSVESLLAARADAA